MRLLGPVAAIVLASVSSASCSSSSDDDFPDPEIAPRATNPDGVPYPTDHWGGAERARGRPGDRIPNLAFKGYVDGNRAAGLQTVSLSDFYDPDRKRHKVLHIQLAATWCAYCSAELSSTVKLRDELVAEGAAFLEIVVSGSKLQDGPSLAEFDAWVDRHETNFTAVMDVRARRMGPLGIDGQVMPWDMLVDTRTMEILESSGGSPADVAVYVRDGLAFVSKNPPAAY